MGLAAAGLTKGHQGRVQPVHRLLRQRCHGTVVHIGLAGPLPEDPIEAKVVLTLEGCIDGDLGGTLVNFDAALASLGIFQLVLRSKAQGYVDRLRFGRSDGLRRIGTAAEGRCHAATASGSAASSTARRSVRQHVGRSSVSVVSASHGISRHAKIATAPDVGVIGTVS